MSQAKSSGGRPVQSWSVGGNATGHQSGQDSQRPSGQSSTFGFNALTGHRLCERAPMTSASRCSGITGRLRGLAAHGGGGGIARRAQSLAVLRGATSRLGQTNLALDGDFRRRNSR
jgi:hypothetical protein